MTILLLLILNVVMLYGTYKVCRHMIAKHNRCKYLEAYKRDESILALHREGISYIRELLGRLDVIVAYDKVMRKAAELNGVYMLPVGRPVEHKPMDVVLELKDLKYDVAMDSFFNIMVSEPIRAGVVFTSIRTALTKPSQDSVSLIDVCSLSGGNKLRIAATVEEITLFMQTYFSAMLRRDNRVRIGYSGPPGYSGRSGIRARAWDGLPQTINK